MKKTLLVLYFLIVQVQASNWELIGFLGEDVSSIIVDPLNEDIIYVGTRRNVSAGTLGKISKSSDGGITWDTLKTRLIVNELANHPDNPNILYAALSSTNFTSSILKSTNAGDTWTWADSGIKIDWETSVRSIAIDPLHPDTLYAGTSGFSGGFPYKSIDGGTSWFRIDNSDSSDLMKDGIFDIIIHPKEPKTVYMAANHGTLKKTVNGGETWENTGIYLARSGIQWSIVIHPEFPETLHVSLSCAPSPPYDECGLYYSSDGGMSFSDIGTGLPDDGNIVRSLEIDPVKRKLYVAVASKDSIPEYPYVNYKWFVYGSSIDNFIWHRVSLDSENILSGIYDITLVGSDIFAGTTKGLYRLDVSTINIDHIPSTLPKEFIVWHNFPNPFNPVTTIRYELPTQSHVNLTIYDMLGREVAVLAEGFKPSGFYSTQWNASNVPSGIYFIQMVAGDFRQVRKVMVLK